MALTPTWAWYSRTTARRCASTPSIAARGAHEYIGEAYLMVGDLGKAKQHLAVLDRLCFFGCEEYDDLKRQVAAYEARGPRGQTPVDKSTR